MLFSLCSPGFTEFLLSSRVLQLAIRIDLAALGFSFENKRILRRESRHLHGWVLVSFFRVSFQFSFVFFFAEFFFSLCARQRHPHHPPSHRSPYKLTHPHTHTPTHPHTRGFAGLAGRISCLALHKATLQQKKRRVLGRLPRSPQSWRRNTGPDSFLGR